MSLMTITVRLSEPSLDEQRCAREEAVCVCPREFAGCWVERMKAERKYHSLRGTDEEPWCEDPECLGWGQRGSLGEAGARSVFWITGLGFDGNLKNPLWNGAWEVEGGGEIVLFNLRVFKGNTYVIYCLVSNLQPKCSVALGITFPHQLHKS